jgi:Na+-driven multidrug efflux pump
MTEVTEGHDGGAATNMLAISFSRRDKAQASSILSDAIAIAAVLGCCLAVAMYFYAPPALRAINGQASAELVEPAVTYVRWRCAEPPGGHMQRNLHYCS